VDNLDIISFSWPILWAISRKFAYLGGTYADRKFHT